MLFDEVSFRVGDGAKAALVGANGTGKTTLLRMIAGDLVPVSGGTVGDGGLGVMRQFLGSIRDDTSVRDLLVSLSSPAVRAPARRSTPLYGKTLVDLLHRGTDDTGMGRRRGLDRAQAIGVLRRYELHGQADQVFDTLSGGQQARLQVLLLELGGATMLLLDEPTDNLDLDSAEALEEGLAGFDGTVLAVTHDRWFARGFDRYLVFGADGRVYETPEPVWDEGRVARAR